MGTSSTFRSWPRSGMCPYAERCGWPRRSRSSGSARCCFGSWPRCVRMRPSALTWTRSAGGVRALTSRPGQSASARRRSTNAPRRWRQRAPTLPRSARSLPLELQVLVRRQPRIVGDEAEPRFRDARTHSLQEGQLPDRKDHGLDVDQLLDAMEKRLALLRVELTRLLLEEPVDVGVPPVGVGAARDHERLQPGGRVAKDAAQSVDNVLELLLLIRLEEPRPPEPPAPRLAAGGLKIVEDRLGVDAGPGIAPEVAGVEAVRVPGFREELPGLARIVGVERRLPVELEAGGDDAPGDLGEPEGHGLVDRLAVDRVVRRAAHAPVVPRRARIPLVGEDQPVGGHERSRPQGEPGRAPPLLAELASDRVGAVHLT